MGGRGFTLIEVLIGMVILGTACSGLISMQVSCLRGMNQSCRLTTAVILAQDKMELLKGLAPSDPDLADTDPGNNTTLANSLTPHTSDHSEEHILHRKDETQTAVGPDCSAYKRFWNVADDTPVPGSKTVVVTVTWEDGAKKVSLSSVL